MLGIRKRRVTSQPDYLFGHSEARWPDLPQLKQAPPKPLLLHFMKANLQIKLETISIIKSTHESRMLYP